MESRQKNAPQQPSINRSNVNDIKTPESISNAYCVESFKNGLRGENVNYEFGLGMAEYKQVPRARREQVSHIFSGEPNNGDNKKQGINKKYIPSNVMFNDEYVEKNPKINNKMKVRYEVEKQRKDEKNKLYSDELRICPEREEAMKRKIKDNYSGNPMEVLTPEKSAKMNNEKRDKIKERTAVIGKYMGSAGLKKIFRDTNGENTNHYGTDKITNGDFNYMKHAIESKKDEPDFKKKGFCKASGADGAYSYMY